MHCMLGDGWPLMMNVSIAIHPRSTVQLLEMLKPLCHLGELWPIRSALRECSHVILGEYFCAFAAACQCFGHSSSCIYNETVNELHLSEDVSGHMSGGGVCIDCKVGG